MGIFLVFYEEASVTENEDPDDVYLDEVADRAMVAGEISCVLVMESGALFDGIGRPRVWLSVWARRAWSVFLFLVSANRGVWVADEVQVHEERRLVDQAVVLEQVIARGA